MGSTSLGASPDILRGLGERQAGFVQSLTGQQLGRDPSFSESFGAIFAQENTIANFLEWTRTPTFVEDPDFQFVDGLIPADLIEFTEDLSGARSQYHLDFLIRQSRVEQERKAIMAATGTATSLLAFAAAGIIAPETLIPFGAGFRAAKIGAGFKASTGLAVSTALGEQAVAEYALQNFQVTRTPEETQRNLLGAALFGSVLGGVGATFGKARRAAITEMTDISARLEKADRDFFQILDEQGKLDQKGRLQIDDAEVIRIVKEEVIAKDPEIERMLGSDGTMLNRAWTKLIARTPVVRGAVDRSAVMRILTGKLNQTALVRRSKSRALRPAVEAEVVLVQGRGIRVVAEAESGYRAYRKTTKSTNTRMDQADFHHNVVTASRRETLDPETGLSTGRWDPPPATGPNPYRNLDVTDKVAVDAIRKASKTFRAFQDQLKELGNEASAHLTISDLAPNSVSKTANSYVHRVYAKQAVLDTPDDFDEMIRQGVLTTDPTLEVNPDQLLAIRQKITGENEPISGHLTITDANGEARTLLIRDDFVANINGRPVAFEDFLENSLPNLISKQIHVFVPRMVLARRMAGPAHIHALRLREAWEAAKKQLDEATDAELPQVANEVDKLRRRVNDTNVLEVMHGQGSKEWAGRAADYEGTAVRRDELMDELVSLEDAVDNMDVQIRQLEEHLAVRGESEVAADAALGGARSEGRVALRLEVEKADLALSRAGADPARVEALETRLVEAEKALEAAKGSAGVLTPGQQKLVRLRQIDDLLVDPDVANRGALSKEREGLGPVREIHEQIRKEKGTTPKVKGDTKAATAKVREVRAELESQRKKGPAKKRLDIEDEVSRVWRAALSATRVQGALAPAYKRARQLIQADPDLKAVAQEFRKAAGIDVEGGRSKLGGFDVERQILQQNRVDTDEALDTALSSLRRQREFLKDNIRSEDLGSVQLSDPIQVQVLKDATSEEVREILDAGLAAGFERIAAVRENMARNAEDMKWWFRQIRAEYDDMISRAGDNTKKVRQLQKSKEKAVADAEHMKLQIFGAPLSEADTLGATAGRTLRGFNYVTKMGGMVLSSIPDMAMGIFTAGFVPWAKMAVRFFSDPRLKSLTKEELVQLIVASEMTMGSLRMARIGDIGDLIGGTGGRIGKTEGLLGKAGVKLTNWSGMARWNATMKAFSSVALGQRMNTIVMKGRGLSKAERQFLELSGVNEEMAGRIRHQISKHGETEKTLGIKVHHAVSSKWDDIAARDVYEGAMIQNVQRTIITPGAGELPIFARSTVGRLILQFRSFSIAASQQIMLSGGQRLYSSGDMAVVQGVMALYSMGMMTEWVKTFVNQGYEKVQELHEKPVFWAVNAIDRSGLLGITADLNAMVETFSGNSIGLSAIHGENQRMSRFASRNAASVVFGPSVGQVSSLFQAGFLPSKLLSTDAAPTASDRTNLRRLVPFQNLWYLRLLMDDLVPRSIIGERKRLEEFLISDDDLKDIDSAFERLISQPVLE